VIEAVYWLLLAMESLGNTGDKVSTAGALYIAIQNSGIPGFTIRLWECPVECLLMYSFDWPFLAWVEIHQCLHVIFSSGVTLQFLFGKSVAGYFSV